MVTLGLHAFTHDASAALAEGGRLRAFAQEERLSRVKGDGRFPALAIAACLGETGLSPSDVERVVLPFRPWVGAAARLAYHLRRPGHGVRAALSLVTRGRGNLGLGDQLRRLGVTAPVARADHHAAHARAVFLASPFERAAVLVVDGVAERWSGASFLAERGPHPRLCRLGRVPFPDSLGLVYAAVTEHLGFRHNREEGKVMAMAAMGTGAALAAMRELVRLDGDRLTVDRRAFDFGGSWTTPAFAARFGPPRRRHQPFAPAHFDLARAVQTVTAEVMTGLARRLLAATGEERLCLVGGLALNPALNSAVAEGSGARELFLLPVGGDAGTAIGAALADGADPSWHLEHAYWGGEVTTADADRALAAAGLRPSLAGPGVEGRVATLLANGAVGGWCRGRSEMGPRALGHRSILADPRRPEVRWRLNDLVKRREPFQPFAPSMLAEACPDLVPAATGDNRFMLRTWPVPALSRRRMPAVIHDDGTTRLHVVTEDDPAGLAGLLRAVAARTGLAAVLNTSLNRRGEPLAETARDAVEVFVDTDLDFLVVADRLVERTGSEG